MKTRLMTVLVLATVLASITIEADAFAPARSAAPGKPVVLAAQGCGVGWHWSRFWHHCVRN